MWNEGKAGNRVSGSTSHSRLKAFGCSCLIAAELSLTRRSPARCSSYRPSLGAKMLILFEICLLSCCPHHPAARTGPSGNRAARMGDYSNHQFLPRGVWCGAEASLTRGKANVVLHLRSQQLDNGFLNIFLEVLFGAACHMANWESQ